MTSVLAQSLVWVSLIIFLIATMVIIFRNNYGFIGLGFCIYWILFYLFPATFHLSYGYFPFYSMFYKTLYQEMAAIATLVFTTFFFFGFFISKPKKNILYNGSVLIRMDRVFLFFIISIVVQIFSVIYFGSSSFLLKRNEISIESFGGGVGSIAFLSFVRTLSFITVLVVCFLLYKKIDSIKYWFGVCVVLSVFFIINYPLALPRYIFFSYILSLLYFLMACKTREKIFVFMCFALGITTVFPALGEITRGSGDVSNVSFSEYYMSSGDFDGFQSVINTMIYVTDNGLSFGYQILGVLFIFIPRSIWLEKPIPTGTVIADHVGYAFTNISSPIISEIFIDFGWFGLPVLAFFIGVLIRKVDMYSIRSKTDNDWVGIFVSGSVFSMIIIIMRGSLMGVMGNVVLFIFLTWLVANFIVIKERPFLNNN